MFASIFWRWHTRLKKVEEGGANIRYVAIPLTADTTLIGLPSPAQVWYSASICSF